MTDVIDTTLPEPGDTADLTEVVAAVREATMGDEAPEGNAMPAETPTQADAPAIGEQPSGAPAPERPLPDDTASQVPVNAPGLKTVPVEGRIGADSTTGHTTRLSWGARSDVGLIRGHNEDSFLVQAPLFGVCDGMGGHAAGEVASAIAVQSMSRSAVDHADDTRLGAAVEVANADVMRAVDEGVGKPGMGCTATFVVLENDRMAVAHVGDSRVYVLHAGTLVRVTHDHSFVEELVDAGEITADEARVHPSRSVITRALGSDPDMYADHFVLEVERGDRVIVCSDGLSSMVPDSIIESVAVSSASPQQAADNLVSCALSEGGHDNVTVVVIDVTDDGRRELRRRELMRHLRIWLAGVLLGIVALGACGIIFVRSSWYLGVDHGNVGIYHGVNASLLGMGLSSLDEATSVSLDDLPDATQKQLEEGINMSSREEAQATVAGYLEQIEADKARAAEAAEAAQAQADEASQAGDDAKKDEAKPEDAATADAGSDGKTSAKAGD